MVNTDNMYERHLCGCKIKARRKARRITQRSAAKSVGVPPSTLCLWEKNKLRVPLKYNPGICALLNVEATIMAKEPVATPVPMGDVDQKDSQPLLGFIKRNLYKLPEYKKKVIVDIITQHLQVIDNGELQL